MGDRSGGREVKGASLKKSKKNPGGVNARGKKAEKVYSGPAESAATPSPGPEMYIDCGAALLSRQFERDRDRVLERARTDGNVAAIVLWFSDVEKQQLLSEVCKDNSGLCYNIVGVHPDNIDKTNKRSHETWMLKVEELARKPECVGILSGYNLGRDVATHFAQESLLKTSCILSDKLLLPLVLHVADGESLLKCIDILKADGWTSDSLSAGEALDNPRRVILHDALTACGGDVSKMEAAVKAGFLCSITAAGITDPDEAVRVKSRACVTCIPVGQLLVCSDSPWRTPQNLPDTYLRTLRNEPSNLPSIIEALSEAIGSDLKDLGPLLRINSIRAFGMGGSDDLAEDDADEALPSANLKRDGGKVKAQKEEENEDELVRKGKKKSKAALLQIFAQNDKKKKQEADGNKRRTGSDSESDKDHVSVEAKAAPSSSGSDTPHFSCHKCRTILFPQDDVLTHALDAARTVFKVGEAGLCKSSIFLSYPQGGQGPDSLHFDAPISGKKSSNNDAHLEGRKSKQKVLQTVDSDSKKCGGFNLAVCGATVECGVCGVKLGKYSHTEAPCSCGIMVPGPTVRITATKVDFVDCSVDAQTLAARSRVEAEKSNLLDELEDENPAKGSKKDKKKKLKSENKGNFSSYRNKSFIKNASRPVKGLSDGEEDEEGASDEASDDDEPKIRNQKNKNKKAPVISSSSSDEED